MFKPGGYPAAILLFQSSRSSGQLHIYWLPYHTFIAGYPPVQTFFGKGLYVVPYIPSSRHKKNCGYKLVGKYPYQGVRKNRIVVCQDDWERLGFGNEKLWPGSSKPDGGLLCSAYMSKICLEWTGKWNGLYWVKQPKLDCRPFAEWPMYKKLLATKKKYEEEKKQKSQKPKAKGSNQQKGSGKTCAVLCWDGWFSGCNKVVKDGARVGWAGSWNDQVSSLKVTKGCKLTA